jgi:hypothetical protein
MLHKALVLVLCPLVFVPWLHGQQTARVDSFKTSSSMQLHEYRIHVPLGQTFVRNGGCNSVSSIRYHHPAGRAKATLDLDTMGTVLIPNISLSGGNTHYQQSVTTLRGSATMTVSRSSVTMDDDPTRYLVELKADPNMPSKMVMNLGYGSAWLDLGGMDIRHLDIHSANADVFISYKTMNTHPMKEMRLNTGMGKLVVRNLERARAEAIFIENGMGMTRIILGEEPFQRTNTNIQVGSGSCTLLAGKNYPVKVVLKTSMFSSVELSPDMIETSDNVFVNLAYKSSPQLATVVVVDVSMGSFSLVFYE